MTEKKKSIIEWIVIGVFLIIVIFLSAQLIRNCVVQSDWYKEMKVERSFVDSVNKIRSNDIEYVILRSRDADREQVFYDFDSSCLEDIKCDKYEQIPYSDSSYFSIVGSDYMFITFSDGTYSFFYFWDNKIYMGGNLEVKCDTLHQWYYDNIDKV